MKVTEQEYLKRVGQNIAKLRKEKGFSQTNVCDHIKMEKSNLSAIENGRQNFTPLTLKKIADFIGVEVKDFFEV